MSPPEPVTETRELLNTECPAQNTCIEGGESEDAETEVEGACGLKGLPAGKANDTSPPYTGRQNWKKTITVKNRGKRIIRAQVMLGSS